MWRNWHILVTTPATVPAAATVLQEFENKVPANLASSCIAIQWEEPDFAAAAMVLQSPAITLNMDTEKL